MSVDVNHIRQLAAVLAQGDTEAEWRSASSRAYYASYHRAMRSVIACPDNTHIAMGSHDRLSDRFKLHGSLGARSICYVLQSMKKQRHIADYEIDGDFLQCYALAQVATYDALVSKLDSFDSAAIGKTA